MCLICFNKYKENLKNGFLEILFVLSVLENKNALITIDDDSKLKPAFEQLLESEDLQKDLGQKAQAAILEHRGAVEKSITKLGELI